MQKLCKIVSVSESTSPWKLPEFFKRDYILNHLKSNENPLNIQEEKIIKEYVVSKLKKGLNPHDGASNLVVLIEAVLKKLPENCDKESWRALICQKPAKPLAVRESRLFVSHKTSSAKLPTSKLSISQQELDYVSLHVCQSSKDNSFATLEKFKAYCKKNDLKELVELSIHNKLAFDDFYIKVVKPPIPHIDVLSDLEDSFV
jgi:hypothetical protein